MQISKRLEAVASFVTEGNRVVDVGTDHGYIPIYLVEIGKTKDAIAMDINRGPLERAESNIKKSGLEDRINTRLSDGLRMLRKDEADTVVIAGMGGSLIIKILSEGKEVLKSVKELVLSPQSEISLVRKYLNEEEFSIIEETMLKEDGKYYTVMKAVRGKMKQELLKENLVFFDYGEYLLRKADPILKEFLLKEENACRIIEGELLKQDSEATRTRLTEIRQQLKSIMEALKYYEM
ncbi:MAG: SAM-dependent methyltransferase [Clostridiales bacterium]|nr:SAM-dependent methyltransferase [Clostridiales bacterium]